MCKNNYIQKQRYAIIKASNDEREEKKCYKQLKT